MDFKTLTIEELKEKRPDLFAAIPAQPAAPTADKTADINTAVAESLTAERKRMTAIVAKGNELGKQEMALESVTAGDTIDRARAKMAEAKLADISSEAPASPGPDNEPKTQLTAPVAVSGSAAPVQLADDDDTQTVALKAEWNANKDDCRTKYSKFDFWAAERRHTQGLSKKPLV